MGGGGTFAVVAAPWLAAAACRPVAIDFAPKRRKQPKMTESPRRMLIRPESIAKPTAATAIMAMVAASGPKTRSLIHVAEEVMALVAGGTVIGAARLR